MKINNSKYSLTLASNGRLGGLEKGEAYKNKKRKAQELYISNRRCCIKQFSVMSGGLEELFLRSLRSKNLSLTHPTKKGNSFVQQGLSNIDITIKEIAKKLGVSVGFVSDCTKQQIIKKLRYSQNHNIQDLLKLNDEQFEALTLQDDMLQDLKKMKIIKESDDYKQLKKSNLLKF